MKANCLIFGKLYLQFFYIRVSVRDKIIIIGLKQCSNEATQMGGGVKVRALKRSL